MFMMIREKESAGLSGMTVKDLLQLPPVMEKLIIKYFYDYDSMNHLCLELWYLFKHA